LKFNSFGRGNVSPTPIQYSVAFPQGHRQNTSSHLS
jgi:hypothetical protein